MPVRAVSGCVINLREPSSLRADLARYAGRFPVKFGKALPLLWRQFNRFGWWRLGRPFSWHAVDLIFCGEGV